MAIKLKYLEKEILPVIVFHLHSLRHFLKFAVCKYLPPGLQEIWEKIWNCMRKQRKNKLEDYSEFYISHIGSKNDCTLRYWFASDADFYIACKNLPSQFQYSKQVETYEWRHLFSNNSTI